MIAGIVTYQIMKEQTILLTVLVTLRTIVNDFYQRLSGIKKLKLLIYVYSKLGPMVGSHGWVPYLGPKLGSKVGSQCWVPKSQLPSPKKGLVIITVQALGQTSIWAKSKLNNKIVNIQEFPLFCKWTMKIGSSLHNNFFGPINPFNDLFIFQQYLVLTVQKLITTKSTL
jgi:hypothetical protein